MIAGCYVLYLDVQVTELEVVLARQIVNGNTDWVGIVHYGLDSEEGDMAG